jgi:acetyl esterase/lipase
MKKIVLLLLLTFILIDIYGQRYLKPVFSSTTITKNIVYGNALTYKHINKILKLDVYEPAGDIVTKRPLIIYMHGGGFTDTNQTKSFPHIAMMCDSFARRGYVMASLDYRLDTSISNRAIINAMHDARAAVRFFKANAATYKIDTTNIFLGGESAGAINSLSVNYIDHASELTYPPVAPYSSEGTVEGNSGNPGYSSKTKATLCFCGGTTTVLLDPVFDTTDMQPLDPALFQIHGTSDPLIPLPYALEVANRAKHVGIPQEFHPLAGATHCPWFWTLPNWQAYLDTLVNYTSIYIYKDITMGIHEGIAAENAITIYPNPFSSVTTIQLMNAVNNATLRIYDLNGREVKQINNISGSAITLQRDNLQSGFYFMRLIQNDKLSSTYKLSIIDN